MAHIDAVRRGGGLGLRGLWSDERSRGLIFQLLVLLGVALVIAIIVSNTIANLQRAGLAARFGCASGS